MDGVQVDTAAVKLLAGEFGTVGQRLGPAMKAVTAKGALNVKNAARDSILSQTTHAYVKQYPNSISYSITKAIQSFVEAEIGPDKGKPQGALGNLLEYGSSKNAPLPHLGPALDAEAGPYAEFLAAAAGEALLP
jgi:hypothetical protein